MDPLHSVPIVQIETPRSQAREIFSPLFAYAASNPLSYIDPLGLLHYIGCSEERKSQLRGAFEDYCKRIKDSNFIKCICEEEGKPSPIPQGLSRLCNLPFLAVRCQEDATGNCEGDVCASAPVPGRIFRVCRKGFDDSRCGPLGCTIMHEMTHLLGYAGEKYPKKVEKCLGCP